MDPEVKDKWIAALRSGDYRQTKDYLFDGDGYCCLGVLECIQGNTFDPTEDADACGDYVVVGTNESENLSNTTRIAAGLHSTAGAPRTGTGIVVGCKEYSCLAQANDDGRTFIEIADAIEKNWKRL